MHAGRPLVRVSVATLGMFRFCIRRLHTVSKLLISYQQWAVPAYLTLFQGPIPISDLNVPLPW